MINKGDVISWSVFSPEIKNGLYGTYILFGDDDFIKNSMFHSIYNQIMGTGDFADFNYFKVSFALNEDPISKLEDSVSSLPMMQDQTLIEVREFNFAKAKKSDFDTIVNICSSIETETVCVFICLEEDFPYDKKFVSSSLYKSLAPFTTFVNCSHLDKVKYCSWVHKKAMSNKCVLSSEAQDILYEMTQGDMLFTENELNKLISYSLSQNETYIVTGDDVKRLCTSMPSEEIDFELNNACATWNIKDVLACINKSKDRQEDPITVINKLETIYSDMLDMKAALVSGLTPNEASKILGINEYRGNLLANTVSKPPISLIEFAVKEAFNADVMVKSTTVDPWLVIDELIIKIYTPKSLR